MDIKELTLDEKIGQMIMAGFPSKYCDDHFIKVVRDYKVGNIDLFSRNIGSIKETANLMNDIQKNMIDTTGIPAFISIDQEGGMVSRIREGAAFFPGNMAVGAADMEESTFKEGKAVGEALRAIGINFDLAPVLDVNNNPQNPIIGTRSYGDNPLKVASLGVDFIKGIQSKKVVAAAKHFPGHGDTSIDTHLKMPLVSYGLDRLQRIEFYPFRQAVHAGVDAIMTAHIVYSALENNNLPASLSYNVLTNLLRKDMGFKGIIVTDCLEMDAVMSNFGIEKASVLAVKAGADMLCISHHLDVQIKSINAIKNAVLSGEIGTERIDESVQRIIDMKEKYDLFKNPFPGMDRLDGIINNPDYLNYARKVSEKSITLVRDLNKLVPLKDKKIVAISTEPAILTGAEDEIKKKFTFSEAVKEKFGGKAFVIPLNPDKDMIERVCIACKDTDRVVIGTYNAILYPGQVKLIDEIKKCSKNIVAVLLRNPYDLMVLDGVSTCICAYEYTPLALMSVLKVLAGDIEACGKLPVRI